jgi:hypothetical protein
MNMTTNTKLLTLAACLALGSPAYAGDNSCLGKIVVEGSQAKIVVEAMSSQPAYTCGTFAVNSPAGRRILKICPHDSECFIQQPLPRGGDVSKKPSLEIKKPEQIERMR